MVNKIKKKDQDPEIDPDHVFIITYPEEVEISAMKPAEAMVVDSWFDNQVCAGERRGQEPAREATASGTSRSKASIRRTVNPPTTSRRNPSKARVKLVSQCR